MKLKEIIWAAAIAIYGTDSLTLAIGLSGRNREKGSLSWGLETEWVEDPSGLPSPSCPKSFEPTEQLHSPHCFPHFSEGRTCSDALLLWKAIVNHAVVSAVSRSFVTLIFPLKWAEIIYDHELLIIPTNAVSIHVGCICHVAAASYCPDGAGVGICVSSVSCVIRQCKATSDRLLELNFCSKEEPCIPLQRISWEVSPFPSDLWSPVLIYLLPFCLHSHPDWSQWTTGTFSGDFSQRLPN